MSTHKSARQLLDIGVEKQLTTTSLFIKKHANPDQLFRQIESLHQSGQLSEARKVIECVIDSYHQLIQSAEFFILYAQVLFEDQATQKEITAALQQSLFIEPENKKATDFLLLLKYQEELNDGLYAQGEQGLREMLEKEAWKAYTYYFLGHHLLWKNGPENEAVQFLERSLELKPRFLKAQLDLALAYKKGQNMYKAHGAFTKCIEIDANESNHDLYRRHLQSL